MAPTIEAPVLNSVELSTGITLQYVEQGDADGTPVVLLHGYVDSWRSFERVLPYLPASLRVFSLSVRGHGDSSRPAAGYEFADFAADLTAFLDAIGIDSAVLVGHSMGSSIAQRFALDQPARTRGLVLIGSVTTWRGNAVLEELWQIVSPFADPIDPTFVREFQESTLAQPVPPAFLDAVVEESLKVPALVWREALWTIVATDWRSELGAIAAPTLITWGDQDGLAPRSEQDALLVAIPDSRLALYTGTGHALHWEEPKRFAANLASFVAGLAG